MSKERSRDIFKRYELQGKAAIITGGSSGIGGQVALDFAAFGVDTVIMDLAPGDRVIKEIESLGSRAVYVKADVSNPSEVEKGIECAVDTFGKIDILVNCAAILSRYKVMEMTGKDWDRIININLKGMFLCSQAAAFHMIKRKSGKIVNIGSASSRGPVFNATQGGPDYCVSKSGVHALTRVFACELAPHGINVNTVAPGPVDTPMHEGEMPLIREKYLPKVPMGRLGKPEDIASVIVFLTTEAASYITGQAIHVNGGMLMVD